MFLKHFIKVLFVSSVVKICNASISQELLLLDTTLVYQLTNTDSRLVDIHHLIGNLISYKIHLSKLIYEYVSKKLDEESKKQILYLKVPMFLRKGFNLQKMKIVYNLSDQQVNDLELEVARIWMNWDQFQKLQENVSGFNITKANLPFFLIKKAGMSLTQLFENGTHDEVHKMLVEFSTYYYFLGKIIKMIIKGDEESISMAKDLYEGEKPEFLKKFVHTSSLRYSMQISLSESKIVKRWIKRISARWFTFLNIYQKKLGIADQPNYSNLNLLKEVDNRLVKVIRKDIDYSFEDLIQDLKTFFEYLCLVLRRNYKHRFEVIEEARKYYNKQAPLFLREISNLEQFQKVLGINNLQFFSVRHFINQINNKWPYLTGTKAENTKSPKVTTLQPYAFYTKI